MKSVPHLLMCLIVAMLLTSCNSTTTSNDPNEVLQLFFESLAKRDIDAASKYVTTDSKPTLEMMKKGLNMAEKMKDSLPLDNSMKDFEDVVFEPARIMGDSAFVKVSSKTNERPAADFKLLKQSNGWKVDFTMSTLMRMGMKSLNENRELEKDSIEINTEEVQQGLHTADSVLKSMDPKVIQEIQKKLESLK